MSQRIPLDAFVQPHYVLTLRAQVDDLQVGWWPAECVHGNDQRECLKFREEETDFWAESMSARSTEGKIAGPLRQGGTVCKQSRGDKYQEMVPGDAICLSQLLENIFFRWRKSEFGRDGARLSHIYDFAASK